MRYKLFRPKRPNTDLLEALTSRVEKIVIECNEGVASSPDMLSEVLDIPLVLYLEHHRRREQELCEKRGIKELAGENVVATQTVHAEDEDFWLRLYLRALCESCLAFEFVK